ncbi:MAG: MFS transporter [Gammaproteobacteria bacterium]
MNRGASLQAGIGKLLNLERGEGRLVAAAFVYFFCLLCSYYIIRPVRDEMGIAGGVDQLQWVFTGTFVVMLAAVPLFGALSARLPRARLLPAVYLFFILNLLLFHLLFSGDTEPLWGARAFFIWVSVFNLFIVSVFWSFMADIFTNAQGKRLFALIAAGGTAGAITGPAITTLLVERLGSGNLLLVSTAFLCAALAAILYLNRHVRSSSGEETRGLGGSIFEGLTQTLGSRYLLGIGLFIWLYATLSTFLYFEQAHIVEAAIQESDARTRLFAMIDLAVNILTLLFQLLVTGRIMQKFGVATALAAMPALLALGFMLLAFAPVLPLLVATQVVRRAGNYALTRPAREVLYTVVPRSSKYKAKNFIDTVLYRGGDAVAGWLFAGMKALGMGLSAIAWTAVPLAIAWCLLGLNLGRQQRKMAQPTEDDQNN